MTFAPIRATHSSQLNGGPHLQAASADVFEALMEALTLGERFRLVERDGELHLVEQTLQ